MKARGVHLQYSFQAEGQHGAKVHNPLFDLLSAVRENGSIQRAAAARGYSYRHVWGELKHWEAVLGQALVSWTQGHPARLTPFAERLLLAETHARARLTPHIEGLRAELEHVMAEALDGSQQVLTLYASHDLALPALRDAARDAERLHIDLRFAGSIDALRALAEGRCLVAGFHVPQVLEGKDATVFAASLEPLLAPARHMLIGCTQRTQGLMVTPGNPAGLRTLADVADQGAGFAQRQAGSATRLLTEHLLAQANVDPMRIVVVRTEESHSALAAAIAGGLADTGIGIEAAARAYGLDFVPLVREDYFLICPDDALERPAVQALRRALRSKTWQSTVAALPGYAVAQAGEVLSLTRALPWWRFCKPQTGA